MRLRDTRRALSKALVVALGLLLAGAPSVRPAQAAPQPLASFVEAVRGYDVTVIRRTFPAYNQGLFERLFGAGEGIPLATDEQRALFAEQVVVTPAGHRLDIGHVITGLEAATALSPSARLVERTTGCTMLADVTWAGDVGQALHDYVVNPVQGQAQYYDEGASPEDLLGDVDGWVLGFEAMGTPVDVAALLDSAYLAGDLEATRFGRFALTLGGTDGGSLTGEARARIDNEIQCFARALALLTGSGVTAEAIAAAAPYFVDRFVSYVEGGLGGSSP